MTDHDGAGTQDELDQAAEDIIPPEQPPMDDAAGGPDVDDDEASGEPDDGEADVTASGAE